MAGFLSYIESFCLSQFIILLRWPLRPTGLCLFDVYLRGWSTHHCSRLFGTIETHKKNIRIILKEESSISGLPEQKPTGPSCRNTARPLWNDYWLKL